MGPPGLRGPGGHPPLNKFSLKLPLYRNSSYRDTGSPFYRDSLYRDGETSTRCTAILGSSKQNLLGGGGGGHPTPLSLARTLIRIVHFVPHAVQVHAIGRRLGPLGITWSNFGVLMSSNMTIPGQFGRTWQRSGLKQ